jgi:poly(3-hydroxybutyrate) depolymerase
MKKRFYIALVCCLIFTCQLAANPIKRTILLGGFEREYLIYTPQHPNAGTPSGILIGLHGFNGSMYDFFNEYDFRAIADSLNCLILAPLALPEQNETVKLKATILNTLMGEKLKLDAVWACGLKVKATTFLGTLIDDELNRDVDDVSFISHIIRQTLDENAMPAENIFMLGTSMGGYMAYQYALLQPIKLAGMVSVAGSMGLAVKENMTLVSVKVPVCDFHSITDEVVPYSGWYTQSGATIYLAQSKAEVIQQWVSKNGAGAPVIERYNRYTSINSITVDKITYPAPVYEVIHYQINNANHNYFFKKEEGDCMDHREEITKFIITHASNIPARNDYIRQPDITVDPSPASDIIYFSVETGNIQIYDLAGQLKLSGSFHSGSLNIASLKPGVYILHIQVDGKTQTTKLVKRYF